MKQLTMTERFILELVNMKPIIDIKQFANDYNIPYNTIRIYISKLIKSKYLLNNGKMIIFNHDSNYTPIFYNKSCHKPLKNIFTKWFK